MKLLLYILWIVSNQIQVVFHCTLFYFYLSKDFGYYPPPHSGEALFSKVYRSWRSYCKCVQINPNRQYVWQIMIILQPFCICWLMQWTGTKLLFVRESGFTVVNLSMRVFKMFCINYLSDANPCQCPETSWCLLINKHNTLKLGNCVPCIVFHHNNQLSFSAVLI